MCLNHLLLNIDEGLRDIMPTHWTYAICGENLRRDESVRYSTVNSQTTRREKDQTNLKFQLLA